MIKKLLRIYPIFILLVLPLIFYYPVFRGFILFPGEDVLNEFYPWKDQGITHHTITGSVHRFFGADPVLAHYPWKYIGINMIKQGIWPLWNPYSITGEPLLANSQSALLYPVNLLYFIFSFPLAWNLSVVLQVILGGLFSYLLFKEWGLSKAASLWGGLIFAWSGFMANFLHIQVIGHTIIWLPLILYLVKKNDNYPRLTWQLLLIFSLSSLFLSGFLQLAGYSVLVVFIYTYFCCRKSFKTLLVSLLVSLLIVSIQIIPTIDYLLKSGRESDAFYDPAFFLLSPLQLIRFLIPRFFGHPNSNNWWGGAMATDHSYFGLLGFIFCVIGFLAAFKRPKSLSWKNHQKMIWVLITSGIFIFTLDTPFTRFFYQLNLPLINSVTPARSLGIMLLPLAYFSALGFEKFQSYTLVYTKKVIKLLIPVIILFLTGYLWILNTKTDFVVEVVQKSLLVPVVIISALGLSLLLYKLKAIPIKYLVVILFLIQLFDLFKEDKFFTSVYTDNKSIYPDTALTDFLKQDPGNRIASLSIWLVPPNTLALYGISSITSYDAIHLKDTTNFSKAVFKTNQQDHPYDSRAIWYSALNNNLYDLLNVKYILSLTPLTTKSLIYINKIGSVYIYENPTVCPPAFLVSDVSYTTAKEIEEEMFSVQNNLCKKIYLEENVSYDIKHSDYQLKLMKKSPGSYSWQVATNEPQALFVSESFDSGWKAFIDDKPVKVYRADLNYISIVIPNGNHKVDLNYFPLSFRIGLYLSLLGFLVLLKLIFFIHPGKG